MSGRVYLDYNATAPVRPEAARAVMAALEVGGNASSIHAAGRSARALIEQAREAVAALAGVRAGDVAFTSGGSEANTLAIQSAIRAGARRLLIGATEHPSVEETVKVSGLPFDVWPVDARGVAELDWLADRLKVWDPADGRPFVALMAANNETGVIQPVAEAAVLVHDAGGWLHVDAVQAAGKIDIRELAADTVAISAHKLGGPAGSGALIVACDAPITRSSFGGGQERGRRGGTENLSGIAGFGAAAAVAKFDARQQAWRDAAAERLARDGGIEIIGLGAPRLPNTLSLAAPGFASDLQVMALDLAGVMVSAGSACSSGKVKASHAVTAMGLYDLAPYALRVSGGWATTEADWDRFADAWLEANARRLTRVRPMAEA
jgi:cysteine desulfurase